MLWWSAAGVRLALWRDIVMARAGGRGGAVESVESAGWCQNILEFLFVGDWS